MTRGRPRRTVMAVVAGCAALAAGLVVARVVAAGPVPVAGPAHPVPDPAGKILSPCTMTAAGGYVYLAGPDQGSSQVWRISTRTGARELVAGRHKVFRTAPEGSSAVAAPLTTVCGLAADARGNLVLSDGQTYWQYTGEYDSPLMMKGDNRVRVVAARSGTFYGVAMRAGDIYTIAGDGRRGFSGDGGPALDAELDGPAAVAVDPAGNVVLADMINQRIRVIAARSGIFYGQPMRAGDIYTIAGGARPAQMPGLPPWLDTPWALVVKRQAAEHGVPRRCARRRGCWS